MNPTNEDKKVISHLEELARQFRLAEEGCAKGGIQYLAYHYIKTAVKEMEVNYYIRRYEGLK